MHILPHTNLGGTEHLAALLDSVETLPDHAHNRAGGHVGQKSREERLVGQVLVVLLEELGGGIHQLQGDELVALLLKASNDLADQAALCDWFLVLYMRVSKEGYWTPT